MSHFLASLCFLGFLLQTSDLCAFPASEYQLKGDYLIGGLFDIHHVNVPVYHDKPEAIDCSSQPFLLPNYRRFQLMRFSVEEINNSADLLPNVSLGYEMFDHCSDVQSFSDVLNLISVDGLIQPRDEEYMYGSKISNVIGVVGPFTSTQVLSVAPLFMVDFIPMVSYGASSSVFSRKQNFPSFLRTVHPNKDVIEVIVNLVQYFKWTWVAFLNSDNDFGIDARDFFIKRIKDTEICLAYTKDLHINTDFHQIFEQIEAQGIHTIIVIAPKGIAEALIGSAIRLNVTNKVWIADDGWSLNQRLPKEEGIKNIGTIIGVAQPEVSIPGFNHFISSAKSQTDCENSDQQSVHNEVCNHNGLSVNDIIDADPSFSFPVYSAVYTIAHALHNVLQCENGQCNRNVTVHPHMILAEMKKSSFTLLNQTIEYDENGDPKFGSYYIVFWSHRGVAEKVGSFHFHPRVSFFINSTKIQWYKNGEVPISICSQECAAGYAKNLNGIYKCCFDCEVCPKGTYINITDDPYRCIRCKETEWSAPGSTSCSPRVVEYVPYTDCGAILIMVGALALLGLTLAMSALFAINYNTPVVRSAGGPMCFLILGCLTLCTVSVFVQFDKSTISFCVLRFLPFVLFYSVCLACFVVRSFQIVCIFKIAAKFPKLHSWWMKYHGQWLVIAAAFVTHAVLLLIIYSSDLPKPHNETVWYPDKIVLSCVINVGGTVISAIILGALCFLCFIFSYMGKDLPKNYNEAKAITFCLLLFSLTWIIFATVFMLYRGKYIQTLSALSMLSSVCSFLFWYFLPKCYIIIFQPHKNTKQYFQGLIQNYTKTISQ